jgi:hypothetical protein
MNEAGKWQREHEELARIFEKAPTGYGLLGPYLRAVAEANKGRRGYSEKTLEKNFGLWRKGRLRPAYFEAGKRSPQVDWGGWTPDQIAALFPALARTHVWFEDAHGLFHGAVCAALTGFRKSASAQKTADALVGWANGTLSRAGRKEALRKDRDKA